jgi:hypothetical protein
MKTTILILLGVAVGWFVHDAIITKIERIRDWRVPAIWALFALLDIAAIRILSP